MSQTPDPQSKTQKSLLASMDMRAVAPFIALVLLLIVGAMVNPNFISVTNLANVATRSAFIAVIAVGATFVISSGDLDLSVGSMVAFVASVMILFMNSGVIENPYLMIMAAMLLASALGAACGFLNGAVTTWGRIEPFIVTLGTMGNFSWPNHVAKSGRGDHPEFDGATGCLPPRLFCPFHGACRSRSGVILAVTVIAAVIMYRTRYGRHVVAVGSSRDVARYSGINVDRVRMTAFIIQGICVAIA